MNPETCFVSPLIIYKINNKNALEYAKKIIQYLLDQVLIKVIYVEELENFVEFMDANILCLFDNDTCNPDLCIVIGGDGTCLWSNYLFKNKNRPPFLTFNLGHLGYMSIYDCEEYIEVLDELYNTKKQLLFEKRSTIECNILNSTSESSIALNDVVIEKVSGTHMIKLNILVDEEPLTEVRCDGLILSTSTGSTAYSLAAGGTILHYDVDAIILNSICPQSLSFRAIAFPRNIKITVKNSQESKSNVINDGIKSIEINGNEAIEIKLSDLYVNFILLEKFIKNRVAIWRQKIVEQLGWNHAFVNMTEKK